MTTASMLGRSAAPHELEHGGRAYHFRALGQRQRTEYERWALARTRGVLAALYEGEELSGRLAELEREALAGEYEFTGPLVQQTLKTHGGAVRLASILAGCSEDEMIALMVARGEEVQHLIRLVLAESVPGRGGPAGNAEGPPPP